MKGDCEGQSMWAGWMSGLPCWVIFPPGETIEPHSGRTEEDRTQHRATLISMKISWEEPAGGLHTQESQRKRWEQVWDLLQHCTFSKISSKSCKAKQGPTSCETIFTGGW